MVGWGNVYKVVEGMGPLYMGLVLGYGSVRWWGILTKEQGEGINKMVCYFMLPLFTLEFSSHLDPFHMNLPFLAADAISKVIIVIVLALWVYWCPKGSYAWSITSFSLSTLTNSLVVGIPLLKAMYGPLGVHLVVQSSIVQAIIWLSLLLFLLEFRKSVAITPPHDLPVTRPSLCFSIKVVALKIALNPNTYASVLGLCWGFISNRFNLHMPAIVEGSVLIMSRAATGTSMFSMGIFMAHQEKFIACGSGLTIFSIVLKFVAGPAAMALASISVGLHADVLRIAIIQAALPQSITSFIFAKEYGLHPEVLSTAVIFGMVVSLPVLIAYYAILEFVH